MASVTSSNALSGTVLGKFTKSTSLSGQSFSVSVLLTAPLPALWLSPLLLLPLANLTMRRTPCTLSPEEFAEWHALAASTDGNCTKPKFLPGGRRTECVDSLPPTAARRDCAFTMPPGSRFRPEMCRDRKSVV